MTGIGIVVQERVGVGGRGPIVEEIVEAHGGIPPGAGEKFAVLRALQIAKERGFTRLKVRSDSNRMRRQLREHHRAGLDREGDDLHREVLRVAAAFAWIDFGYVPRRRNQVAHRLARAGRTKEPTDHRGSSSPCSRTGPAPTPPGQFGRCRPGVLVRPLPAR
ncbi:MAG: ribonuclease H-like domain-containing protein [Candidatus Rokubacteria bacterium]|nr:ribonuclease H-like domain-containing protein [Candidatus Rokubacteria bacterium]